MNLICRFLPFITTYVFGDMLKKLHHNTSQYQHIQLDLIVFPKGFMLFFEETIYLNSEY